MDLAGVGALHAAFLNESRTSGCWWRPCRKSGEGLGINPEDDLPAPACRGYAVGAALNLGPLPPVSLSIFAKSEKLL